MSFCMRSSYVANGKVAYPYKPTFQSNESPVPSAPPLENHQDVKCSKCPRSTNILTCYTVVQADGVTSCAKSSGCNKLVMTTDSQLASIPAGAIIDSIEFFGVDSFTTKDTFSIGLGQLNQGMSFPLIQDADAAIANERVGGCREFSSSRSDGKNDKNIVLCDSTINIETTQPITLGYLQIVIRYHFKMI
jgi:hypothetical protein